MGFSRNTKVFLLFASLAPTTAWWSVSAASSFFSRGSRSWGTVQAAAASPAECASVETTLGANTDLLTDKQNAMVASLLALDQEHLFEDWPALGSEDADKKRLLKQLESLDQSYPGGLETYIAKARDLLESSARGDNPFDGMTPSVPTGEDLEYGDEEYRSMEKLGLEAAAKSAFVLVAGGLGERLGYSGIKLALPVSQLTQSSFLKMYADWILSIQERCRESTGDSNIELPLVIMTSGDTDAPTRALLEKESNYGLSDSQVNIVMQDKVPALSDSLGRLTVNKSDRWNIETKPHGHGDVHHLLHRSGLAEQWSNSGKKWAFFFQDTNPLVIHALLPMLGVSVDRDYDMNSLCVPRRGGEAAGAITTLTRENGESLTINVEYNQLDPMLRESPDFKDGDVDDPETGFSVFPGNVNNLLVKIPSYAAVLAGPDQGVVDEFVNPKYKDDTRTTFKKPTRLECMMQDLPLLLTKQLGSKAKVGFTTMQRWLTFSPAKNDPESGAESAKKGSPPGSPSSAEADFYAAYLTILETASGATIERAEPVAKLGIPVQLMPAVVLEPSFALTSEEVSEKFKGGKISSRSTLVVEGAGVEIEDLDLDGALVIKVGPGVSLSVKGLKVQNKGWAFTDDPDAPEEEIRIRGYRMTKGETMEIVVTEPGSYTVDSAGAVQKA